MIKWKSHPEMTTFMLEYIPGHQESEIREEFHKHFGIILTEGQIGNFKHHHKIKSDTHGGRFKKGLTAHNKGQKMSAEVYAKAKPTMFRKGHVPHNHRPVGSERKNVDGYIEIKIAEPNKWMLKQRKVWQDHYKEKLTRNDAIIFLDGNRENFDINNLAKLNRAELARYNQDHLYGNNREISRAAASIAKIKTRSKRRNQNERYREDSE